MEENLQNKIYNHLDAFAKNIKLERLARGWTQKDVAAQMEIKTQSYQAYESGVAVPTIENLLKISIIFDMSIDDLFEL